MSRNTKPAKVGDGLANLVLLTGEQMDSRQWIRELVVNVAENGGDRVVFDAWIEPDTDRALARVSDNGCGMTEAALIEHVATILNSGHGYANNYGWGSRVSTLFHNPRGVHYASRAAGVESLMTMQVERNVIGPRVYELEDGKRREVVDPFDGMLDRVDRLAGKTGSGTAVILNGNGKADTWDASTVYRTSNYITTRFYEYPTTSTGNPLTVHVYRDQLRRVPSFSETLGKVATATGVLPFDTGTWSGRFHWAIVPNVSRQAEKIDGTNAARGGAGVLCSGEIFDLSASNLDYLGIAYASVKRRVVVLVEVDGGSMNPARSSVVFKRKGRNPLTRTPWRELGAWFAENTPPEIQALIDDRKGDSTSIPAALAAQLDPKWKERLGYVPVKVAGGETPGVGDDLGDATPAADPAAHGDQVHGSSGTAARPVRRSASGSEGSHEELRQVLPSVVFVDRAELGDDNPYGVVWNEATGTMLVANDLAPFRRTLALFAEELSSTPFAMVEDAVKIAFALELASAVVDSRQAEEWGLTPTERDALLEPPALLTKTLGAQAIDTLVRAQLRYVKANA